MQPLRPRSLLAFGLGLGGLFGPPPAWNATPLEAPASHDLAVNLADRLVHDSPSRMDAAGLQSARLESAPWSGSYWPLRLGGLAFRPLDPAFPRDAGWSAIARHVERSLGRAPADELSPAEKYDLLVGDAEFTLTRRMLALSEGRSAGDSIAAWYGFCTGWANAAMMMPRPRRSVTVTAADGRTTVTFLPDDLKALASLLWSSGRYAFRVAGTSCTEEPVREDPATGRAVGAACRDTNPATLHLSVINQLGVARRSLLIDSDPGEQVWNQPVSAYSVAYFHPRTGVEGTFNASRLRLSDHPSDPFAAHRAPGTQSLIGVKMALTFVHEKEPDGRETDDASTDASRTPVYEYELELDAFGKIIGGEWRSPLHPDLLWVAALGAYPTTSGDRLLDERAAPDWNLKSPLPADWSRAAAESARRTLPLGRIVNRLFEESNR